MQNKSNIVIIAIIFIAAGTLYFLAFPKNKNSTQVVTSNNQIVETKDKAKNKTDTMEKENIEPTMQKVDNVTTPTKYRPFNQEEFDKAMTEDKIIFLNFYANWCPICRAEEPGLTLGLNKLNKDNVVAFKVNFKDTETDDKETELAKTYGITYQHSKVIIKGEDILLKEIASTWKAEDVERKFSEVENKLEKENK